MPKRDVIVPVPVAGLNLLDPPSRLRPGQSYKAENVIFAASAVKRRLGKAAAYQPTGSISSGVDMIARFYDLAVSGTVNKYLFLAALNSIYRADSDWDDDTGTTITSWTQCQLPSGQVSGNNTLYDGYTGSATTIVLSQNVLKASVEAASWLYLFPEYLDGDTAVKTTNVPMRTKGAADGQGTPEVEMFLHGLVPPLALDTADSRDNESGAVPTFRIAELVDNGGGNVVGAGISIDTDSDRSIHVAYQDFDAPSLKYATRAIDSDTWTTSTIHSAAVHSTSIELVIDSNDNPHVSFALDAGGTGTSDTLMYATKLAGQTTWNVETVNARDVFSTSIVVDSSNVPHIVYDDNGGGATDGDLIHVYQTGGGTWSSTIVDDSSSTSRDAGYKSLAIDSSDNLHCVYTDTVGNRLRYAKRTSGTWGDYEEVSTDTINNVRGVGIAVNSSDVPAAIYHETSGNDVRFAQRTGGTWSVNEDIEAAVGALGFGIGEKAIHFDAYDNPCVVYFDDNNDILRYGKKIGGSWTTATIITSYLVGVFRAFAIDNTGDWHVAYQDETNDVLRYVYGTINAYYYRLTAEYDDGKLGESGPSDPAGIAFTGDIALGNANILLLNSGTGVYDMTDDVTKIHIYRTVRGAASDGTYFRVGSVDCSGGDGAPDGDFTDNVPDADLVVGRTVLDEDVYLPPKYKTAVYWKDRLVIGHIKCRDSADEDQLDWGESQDACVHKNRVRFSEAFQPDRFRANFFQDIVPDTDSGSITAMIVNPIMDALFVIMENDVVALTDPVGDLRSSLSFRPRNVAGARGSPARKGIVSYDGLIFMVTKTGIDVISGYQARNITSKTIGPLWNLYNIESVNYDERINMDRIGQIVAGVSTENGRELIYFAYPAADSTYNNRVFVLHYDLWKEQGLRGDPPYSTITGWDVSEFCRWDGEGDRGELFGGEANSSDEPWIYRLDYGNSDVNGTTGSSTSEIAIPTQSIYSGLTDAGRPDLLKAWVAARVEIRGVTSPISGFQEMALKFIVDEGQTPFPLTLDTFNVSLNRTYHPTRETRMIPRTAIGVNGGSLVEITETTGSSTFPAPWDLLGLAYTVRDLPSRHRGARS